MHKMMWYWDMIVTLYQLLFVLHHCNWIKAASLKQSCPLGAYIALKELWNSWLLCFYCTGCCFMLLLLCSLAFSSIHCASFEFLYGSICKQAVLKPQGHNPAVIFRSIKCYQVRRCGHPVLWPRNNLELQQLQCPLQEISFLSVVSYQEQSYAGESAVVDHWILRILEFP